jgi:hypothetical protein
MFAHAGRDIARRPWRHACPRGYHLGSGGRCGGKLFFDFAARWNFWPGRLNYVD